MWEFGGDDSPAYKAQLKFDRLRYRLLPYVYSLAAAVTRRGRDDHAAAGDGFSDRRGALAAVDDQYMFGPALMVSPVTAYKVRERARLPAADARAAGTTSGPASSAPAGTRQSPAPFDAIPVHVRAGSIVPFGPELQYTDEKPADPITLFVYAGSDGAFTLYEDDGVSHDYEKGAFATIPLRWHDAQPDADHRQAAGSLPGHARPADVPGGAGREGPGRCRFRSRPRPTRRWPMRARR